MRKGYASIALLAALFVLTVSFSGCKSKTKGELNTENKSGTTAVLEKSKDNNTADVIEKNKEGNLENTQKSDSNANKSNDQLETIKNTKEDLKGEKVGIFIKDATVGVIAKVIIDDKQIDKSKCLFYQIYNKGKPVSKISKINEQTTMYPIAEIGSKVQIKIYDNNQKLTFTFDAVIKKGN